MSDMDSRSHTVRTNGIEMYCEEYGAGEPLVLLHGFGGCARNWRPFISQLSKRRKLILVDLRGHGHSTNPENTFTHRQAANDVSLALESLGIDRFSAMGISSGGMILLHLAMTLGSRIESMVLVSATSTFPDQARAIFREASFERMPPDVRQMYRDCATRGDEQIRRLVEQFKALNGNHDDMNLSASDLSTIRARTLVVHGDRDRFFPVELAVGIYRAIPKAALWIIPDGDHVPIYDPAVPFTATALRFFDGPEGKQSLER